MVEGLLELRMNEEEEEEEEEDQVDAYDDLVSDLDAKTEDDCVREDCDNEDWPKESE
jgi:hypothetical protein